MRRFTVMNGRSRAGSCPPMFIDSDAPAPGSLPPKPRFKTKTATERHTIGPLRGSTPVTSKEKPKVVTEKSSSGIKSVDCIEEKVVVPPQETVDKLFAVLARKIKMNYETTQEFTTEKKWTLLVQYEALYSKDVSATQTPSLSDSEADLSSLSSERMITLEEENKALKEMLKKLQNRMDRSERLIRRLKKENARQKKQLNYMDQSKPRQYRVNSDKRRRKFTVTGEGNGNGERSSPRQLKKHASVK
mmetsp:Transcript_30831/g.34379  ORF Transcript_30831/g.34379 Transcript_30831/m.34379 type:complete len:246 (+) Transcript_30831:209-946(+)